jgi:hypothetical protein
MSAKLQLVSTKPNFLLLGQLLSNHPKGWTFGTVKVGKWSISTTANADKVEALYNAIVNVGDMINLKRVGDRCIIWDWDVKTNRAFLGIFGKVPDDATEAGLGVRLAVGGK